MITTGSIRKVRALVKRAKDEGKVIGFVPTMGALHSGHLSLIRKAKEECGYVVVSIFVNPTQFGPKEDYKKYPRAIKKDKKILLQERVDLLFYPSVKEIYPQGFSTYVEETYLSKVLCGKSRPGHFRGVCTVVAKLFNIVLPDIAYFGQKDYQQAQIIKRMVKDLNFSLRIKVLPIVREKDGLAMSSRNSYLNQKQRKNALCLYRALKEARKLIEEGERSSKIVISRMKKIITSCNGKVDYIKVVDPYSLRELKVIDRKVLIALAVFIGGVRLIDNFLILIKKPKNRKT